MAGEYEPARSLAETQLQIQFAILGSLETQALGLLGVNVALATLAVATQSVLDRFWWLSVLGFAASGSLCLVAILGDQETMGPPIANILKIADRWHTGDDTDRYVAESLHADIKLNRLQIRQRSTFVGAAIGLLVLALALAVISGAIVS